jgi:hypothetical protein
MGWVLYLAEGEELGSNLLQAPHVRRQLPGGIGEWPEPGPAASSRPLGARGAHPGHSGLWRRQRVHGTAKRAAGSPAFPHPRCGVLFGGSPPKGLIICRASPVAESCGMTQRRRYNEWSGKYPPGSPAEWIAEGHVTCNVHCLSGRCNKRMVNVRLDTLPQDQPWSIVGWRFMCKQCGTAGLVNITPNWHDRVRSSFPFRKRGTLFH